MAVYFLCTILGKFDSRFDETGVFGRFSFDMNEIDIVAVAAVASLVDIDTTAILAIDSLAPAFAFFGSISFFIFRRFSGFWVMIIGRSLSPSFFPFSRHFFFRFVDLFFFLVHIAPNILFRLESSNLVFFLPLPPLRFMSLFIFLISLLRVELLCGVRGFGLLFFIYIASLCVCFLYGRPGSDPVVLLASLCIFIYRLWDICLFVVCLPWSIVLTCLTLLIW